MATLNELRKKYNIKKDEFIEGMDEDEVKRTILQLTKNYYVNYFNNDKKQYTSTLNMIEFIAEAYDIITDEAMYFNNMPNFINYCMVLSINMILSDLFERDFTLKEPYYTNLIESRYGDSLAEFIDDEEALRVVLEGSKYDKPIFNEYAELEDMKEAIPYLERILTSHGMERVNGIIAGKERRKAIEDDKKYGWRDDL